MPLWTFDVHARILINEMAVIIATWFFKLYFYTFVPPVNSPLFLSNVKYLWNISPTSAQ